MASLNKVQIIGNLGADPEMRFTANGRAVTTLRIAVNRSYTTQDGERHEETEWVRVVAWQKLAELASQYLAKGRSVLRRRPPPDPRVGGQGGPAALHD